VISSVHANCGEPHPVFPLFHPGLSQKHFIREAVVFHAWNCKLHEVASGWETIEIFIDCLIPAVHPLLSREISCFSTIQSFGVVPGFSTGETSTYSMGCFGIAAPG